MNSSKHSHIKVKLSKTHHEQQNLKRTKTNLMMTFLTILLAIITCASTVAVLLIVAAPVEEYYGAWRHISVDSTSKMISNDEDGNGLLGSAFRRHRTTHHAEQNSDDETLAIDLSSVSLKSLAEDSTTSLVSLTVRRAFFPSSSSAQHHQLKTSSSSSLQCKVRIISTTETSSTEKKSSADSPLITV